MKILNITDVNGIEFWYARELMPILQYSKWDNFKNVIEKAMSACENSKISIKDCFFDVRKPIKSLKQLEKENKKSLKKQGK